MKITIFHNKGYLLLESIITIIFTMSFLFMFNVLIKTTNDTTKYIREDEKIVEYIKLMDSLVYKVKISEKVNITSTSIELDTLKIYFKNNSIYISSGKMIKKELLFKANSIKFFRKKNMLIIYCDFKKESIKRKILIE